MTTQLKNIAEDTREHLKALQNEMNSCAEKLGLSDYIIHS